MARKKLDNPKAESIAKQVARIVDADLYIKRALMLGIANASAVAELIRKEHLPNASFVAVKAAVMRYADAQEDYVSSGALKNLLSKTKVSIRSGISVIHISPRFKYLLKLEKIYEEAREFAMIESDSAITLIVDDDLADEVLKTVGKASVINVERDNSVIYLISPEKIASTPGFVAFTTDLLVRQGVNVREIYSCYTDTVLVLSKEDAIRAYQLLDSMG